MSSNAPTQNTRFAFGPVTTLFFMWGFITCMNDLDTTKRAGFYRLYRATGE